jgi:hypothetical protein
MSSTTRALATQADLKELGDNIRGWHQQVRLALGNALSFAMDAGDALIAAQQRLPHGSWLPWLKNHCDLGERTAQLYMQLADGRATIESQIRSSAADLSLRAALRLIAPKKSGAVSAGKHGSCQEILQMAHRQRGSLCCLECG